jgi:hypothetical protein
MAEFPAAIYAPRVKANKAGVVYNAANTTVGYAEDVTKLDAEVVALQTLFGKNDDAQTVPVAGAVLKGKAAGKAKWTTEIFIDTGGKVGIGTITPSSILEVWRAAGVWTDLFNISTVSSGDLVTITYEETGPTLRMGLGRASPESIGSGKTVLDFRGANGAGLVLGSTAVRSYITNTGGSTDIGSWNDIPFVISYNNVEKYRFNTNGYVGILTNSPTTYFDVNGNAIRIRTAATPASAGAAGNAGHICWDTNYIYVCVATNTWKRIGIATW